MQYTDANIHTLLYATLNADTFMEILKCLFLEEYLTLSAVRKDVRDILLRRIASTGIDSERRIVLYTNIYDLKEIRHFAETQLHEYAITTRTYEQYKDGTDLMQYNIRMTRFPSDMKFVCVLCAHLWKIYGDNRLLQECTNAFPFDECYHTCCSIIRLDRNTTYCPYCNHTGQDDLGRYYLICEWEDCDTLCHPKLCNCEDKETHTYDHYEISLCCKHRDMDDGGRY